MFGARPLARVIQTEVRDPLTDEILFGALEHGGTVTIGVDGERLTFDVTPQTAIAAPAAAPGPDDADNGDVSFETLADA